MAVTSEASEQTALRGYNVLLQAEDDAGLFFVAYGCVAHDPDHARALAQGAAQAEGCWGIAVDEVWEPEEEEADLPSEPQVLGRTGRSYVGDEDIDEYDA
ncbi:MAG: hypothetical protein MI723_17395 [Caulobacterales bacterium]|nr:hypothetical protein [Caulobacterales bacterium]